MRQFTLAIGLMSIFLFTAVNAATLQYNAGTPGTPSYIGFEKGAFLEDLSLYDVNSPNHYEKHDYNTNIITWVSPFDQLQSEFNNIGIFINYPSVSVTPSSYLKLTIICANQATTTYSWSSQDLNSTQVLMVNPPAGCADSNKPYKN